MLLTLLFHRAGFGKYANSIENLDKIFKNISDQKRLTKFPGEFLEKFKNIHYCITFDDAFFDFYLKIFPLLKKYNLKALLAVPAKYILDDTDIDNKTRLNVDIKEAFEEDVYRKKAPFCTFKEILEMTDTGLVQIASHSYSHQNLLNKNIDLDKEIIKSKIMLEKKLNIEINSFVYPMGKFNKQIHKFVQKHYKYIFRIGTAINFSWQNFNNLNYRIVCDNTKSLEEKFYFSCYLKYFLYYLINTFKGR